ncbi:MAG: hypothetical protein EXR52_05870 [Dehalococcoidia bacterium]|nr:hypothetical protein [Dehalococcoidia bacterium]
MTASDAEPRQDTGGAGAAAGAGDTLDRQAEGTVYLLHFSEPIGAARHYLGWSGGLEARLAAHGSGRGGRATKALVARGGSFALARTWPGGRALETHLRKRGPKRLCPICAGSAPEGMIPAATL